MAQAIMRRRGGGQMRFSELMQCVTDYDIAGRSSASTGSLSETITVSDGSPKYAYLAFDGGASWFKFFCESDSTVQYTFLSALALTTEGKYVCVVPSTISGSLTFKVGTRTSPSATTSTNTSNIYNATVVTFTFSGVDEDAIDNTLSSFELSTVADGHNSSTSATMSITISDLTKGDYVFVSSGTNIGISRYDGEALENLFTTNETNPTCTYKYLSYFRYSASGTAATKTYGNTMVAVKNRMG